MIIQTYELWDGELDYINMMLEQDLRNNSAWNQRYFIVSHTTKYTKEVLAREVKWVLFMCITW